ncbi:MAG: hypothetical protein V4598_15410 [Bdellovibrionota bacterium]
MITAVLTISGLGADTIAYLPPEPPCEQPPVVTTPLEEVVPQCMAQRQQTRDPVELIAQDLGVCQCLESRNALFPEALSKAPANDAHGGYQTLASSTANNQAMGAISSSSSQRNLETRLLTQMGETRGRIATPVPGSQLARMTPAQRESLSPKISENITQVNIISESRKDNQCVTYIEYSAQRELPYDNNFFSFLGRTTSFREDDWKIESLRTAYDATTNAEQRQSIVARMEFLSRNPQYSALFRAGAIEGVTPAAVRAKKTELFNIIRNLAPASGSNCATVENQCWREAQGSGAYRRFSQQAEALLLQNDVIDIVSAQSSTDYLAEVARISSEERIPVTPRGYSDFLQSEQQEIAFGCSGPTAQASCYERFALHCSRVRRIHNRATESVAVTGNDILNELSAAQKVHGLLNPDQNLKFEGFNDLICLQNYQNASGQSSNFFTFRNRVCSGTSPAPECPDRRALLARFLREYNVGGEQSNLNVRAGFADALVRPAFLAVTEMQVAAVNRITESPRALRAQFGGGYPTITSTGQLARYTPSGSSSGSSPGTVTEASRIGGSSSAAAAVADTQRSSDNRSTQGRSDRSERSPDRQSARIDSGDGTSDTRSQPTRQPSSEYSGTPMRRPPSLPPVLPQVGPQPIITPPTPERRPASNQEQADTPEIRTSGGGSQISVQAANGGGVVAGGTQNAAAAQPIIEMPRKRPPRSQLRLNEALMQKYENVSADPTSQFQRELIERPAVAVPISAEIISSVVNDPSVLASEANILAAVNSSSDPVVKLSLETEGGSPVVVYASKENGQVAFSFTPPAPVSRDRSPASLGDNEMNVRLQSGVYERVRDNPASLGTYENVVRSAMSLPGDVVRLNVISEGSDPISVYVDKRGPRPVFTADDPLVIRAYRP